MTTDDKQANAPQATGDSPALVSYYQGTLTASQCLARLRRDGRFASPDAAQHELLTRLDELDPELARTWSLVKGEVRKARPLPLLVEWLHRVVTTVHKPDAVPQSVRQAVATLTSECLPTRGAAVKRSLNAWRLGVLDLRWQRELDLEQLTIALAEHFVRPGERVEALEARVLVTVMGASKAQLTSLAAAISWMTRQTAAQGIELSRIRGELEAIQEQRSALRLRVSELEAECERLSNDLQEANGRETAVQKNLRDAEDAATLRLHGLAGRAAGELTGRVLPLLQQAEDALTMAEPSVRAALEFVNTARTEGEGLRQWLRAASTSEPPTA